MYKFSNWKLDVIAYTKAINKANFEGLKFF